MEGPASCSKKKKKKRKTPCHQSELFLSHMGFFIHQCQVFSKEFQFHEGIVQFLSFIVEGVDLDLWSLLCATRTFI